MKKSIAIYNSFQQECIPVGCIPGVLAPGGGVCSWGSVPGPGGVSAPRGCLVWGGCLLPGGGVPGSGGVYPSMH